MKVMYWKSRGDRPRTSEISDLASQPITPEANHDISRKPRQREVEEPQKLDALIVVGVTQLGRLGMVQSDRYPAMCHAEVGRHHDSISERVGPLRLDRRLKMAFPFSEPSRQGDFLIQIEHRPREDFHRESNSSEKFHHRPTGDRGSIGVIEITAVRDEKDAANGRRLLAWSLAVDLGSGRGRGGWAAPDAPVADEPSPYDDRKGQASKPEVIDMGECHYDKVGGRTPF